MNETSTLMIVDDEGAARDTAAALLAAEGYDLVFADSGPRALDMLRQRLPDAILSDMMMPGMDGLQLCEAIKAREGWRHVPVIMMAALQGNEHLARALVAGADDFVSKPVSGLELRARVRSMLRIKRQHDELRQVMGLRDDLSHMVVHDLRNPLSVLQATADMLAHRPAAPAEFLEPLECIQGLAERMNGFLNDMLLLAKLEDGKLAPNRRPTTVGDFVQPLEANFRVRAEPRGLRFRVDVTDPECAIAIDAPLLSRVLDNLISNAFKFSPRGSEVALCLDTAGGALWMRVVDQGEGIPEAERPRLFQKFATVPGAARSSRAGLGLAFCKLAVEAHAGRIIVEHNAPTGAMFTVEVPANRFEALTGDDVRPVMVNAPT